MKSGQEDLRALKNQLANVLMKEIERLSEIDEEWFKLFQSLTLSNRLKDDHNQDRHMTPVELVSTNLFHLNNLPDEFVKPLLRVHQLNHVPAETLAKVHQHVKHNMKTPIKEGLLEMVTNYLAKGPATMKKEVKEHSYWQKLFQHPDTIGLIAVKDHLQKDQK